MVRALPPPGRPQVGTVWQLDFVGWATSAQVEIRPPQVLSRLAPRRDWPPGLAELLERAHLATITKATSFGYWLDTDLFLLRQPAQGRGVWCALFLGSPSEGLTLGRTAWVRAAVQVGTVWEGRAHGGSIRMFRPLPLARPRAW